MSPELSSCPRCSMCAKCCAEQGHGLTITREDYKRWRYQRRTDILRYVWKPERSNGFGDIWIDPKTGEDLDHCPFLVKVGRRKPVCSIHDTKPEICREFWCEWAYGAGNKGVPFKTIDGWSEKAKQLGYDSVLQIRWGENSLGRLLSNVTMPGTT
jgi:Fe-S-cluster containining protein